MVKLNQEKHPEKLPKINQNDQKSNKMAKQLNNMAKMYPKS